MMFFCWERSSQGWAPVVYHEDKPKPEKVPDGERPRRSPLVTVPEDCIANGEPLFGELQKRFPAPAWRASWDE